METKEFIEKYGKHLPKSVELYYVDYRDDLSNNMSPVQKAISSGDYSYLNETIFEELEAAYQDTLGENIRVIQSEMRKDGIPEDEIEGIEDDIRYYLQEHDTSDPVKQLIRNTGDITLFYATGIYLYNEEDKRKWLSKFGVKGKQVEELIDNSYDGGELRVYFSSNIAELIEQEKKYMVFDGAVNIAIINSNVGSGWYEEVNVDNLKLPFNRKNLIISSLEKWGLEDIFGTYIDWCDKGVDTYTDDPEGAIGVEESGSCEKIERDIKWEEDARKGICHIEDPDFRHHDMEYENSFPCGWKCKRCGKFVID